MENGRGLFGWVSWRVGCWLGRVGEGAVDTEDGSLFRGMKGGRKIRKTREKKEEPSCKDCIHMLVIN